MPSVNRTIFLVHRYLGISLGLVVTLWCLSGFVMMYVPYPELSPEEQLAGSADLDLDSVACCTLPAEAEFSAIDISNAEIVSWPSGPLLFLEDTFGDQYPIDLKSGVYLAEITKQIADENALQYSQQFGLGSEVGFEQMIEVDQWTVYGSYSTHRPLFHYIVNDGKGSRLYVSSTTGEVVLHTTRAERGWNWVGSVVHWIYPTTLRQNQTAWFWTVVILSGISLFLCIVGVYVAICYLQINKKGPISPFQGWGLWHHYIGLIFGLFTMTWLFSGLLSMTPFSALQGRSISAEMSVVRGDQSIFGGPFRQHLEELSQAELDSEAVRIKFVSVEGKMDALVYNRDGSALRYNPSTWMPEKLNDSYFQRIGQNIRPEIQIEEQGWIDQEDAYFYSRRLTPPLPAYRVIYEDGERAYFDRISGELLYLADNARQWNRWLFTGLHSLDFWSWIRAKPVWDIIVLLLLGGVTAGAITGTWLGCKRIYKDLRSLRT